MLDPALLQRLLEEFVQSRPQWQSGQSVAWLRDVGEWPASLARRCQQAFPAGDAALAVRSGRHTVAYRMTTWSNPQCFAVLEVDSGGWSTVQLYRRQEPGVWSAFTGAESA